MRVSPELSGHIRGWNDVTSLQINKLQVLPELLNKYITLQNNTQTLRQNA